MKKIVLLIILALFVTPSFFALPGELLEAADKPEKPKKISRAENYIAVLDLETVDVGKKISRPLTDSIRLEIVKSGKWKVIERSNMDKIMKEQKFQQSCSSTECIVEVGQLLGVGKMIMGSVSIVGKTYYLSLQLVNVESGQIENVSEDKCKCEIDDLIDSSKRLVKRLLGEHVATPQTTVETQKPAEAKSSVIASEAKQSQQPPQSPLTKGESKGDVTDTSGIEMVFVKGGCYQMGEGSYYTVHEVCLDDFYIGKYEVTQGQWKAVMGNNPSYFKDCGDNCPVEDVSWNDIQDFINKLNNKTGKSYRLPTEAEWEYAARSGGKSEKYSGTSSESEVKDYAWYTDNSGSKAHPVGQKKPNGLGLYDMSGNVWEWVSDWYDSDYYKNSPKNNPTGPSSGKEKVQRGGSWYFNSRFLEAAYRYWNDPTYRLYDIGFRLVSSPK